MDAQNGVWKPALHGHLHHRHDFSGFGPNHRKAENLPVAGGDDLHESVCLAGCKSKNGGHGHFRKLKGHSQPLC